MRLVRSDSYSRLPVYIGFGRRCSQLSQCFFHVCRALGSPRRASRLRDVHCDAAQSGCGVSRGRCEGRPRAEAHAGQISSLTIMDKKSKVELAHLALAFDLPTTVITLHADNGASRTPTVSHSWLWRGNVIVLAQRYLLDHGYTTAASAIAQETNISLDTMDVADNIDLGTIVSWASDRCAMLRIRIALTEQRAGPGLRGVLRADARLANCRLHPLTVFIEAS